MSDLDPKGGTLKLYRGKSIHEGRTRYEDASRAVHMDAAGAYLTREKYLVMSRELPVPGEPGETVRLPVEPIRDARARATAVPGSPLSNDVHEMGSVREVEYGDGTFMAITQRGIWRRAEGGSWTQVYAEEDEERLGFTRLAYANGTWLAAQGGHQGVRGEGGATQGWVLRSNNNGNSWDEVQFPVVGQITFLQRGSGNWWVAGFYYNTTTGSVGGWARSPDGGATWQNAEQSGGGSAYRDAVFFDDGGNVLIIEDHPPEYGDADLTVLSPSTWARTLYRDWVIPGPTWPDFNSVSTHPRAHRMAMADDYHVVIVSTDGRVSTLSLNVPYPGGNIITGWQNRGSFVAKTAGMSSESGGTVSVSDIAYDPVGDVFIAVGGFTPFEGAPQARAWRSRDNGLSWQRITEVEEAMQTPIASVAVDSQGDALYLNGARWLFSGATRGLEGGQYNVYVVSYFNTHAGKFVYDMHMEPLTTEDGGGIRFSAPHKEAIFDANSVSRGGWMTDEHRPLLDDLRFDVYVQAVREPIGDEDVAYTIRYAFTEPFPEEPADPDVTEVRVGRTLDALPLGRNLLTYGLPTTAVFEKRHTALHGGRVWGMAAQDESRWSKDPASPEVANQAQRFVLSYSEVGWANLMGDRSFIVIQPTQSTRFTGLLSTPSGLLVMFENEIHLVTGDPAFGNVSVELYLDMVGCDEGTHPAKVGGVPFTIWRGKLWVLQAGQAQQIGAEQWLASDPFVRVSPEPQTRSLLALTKSGLVFRYMLDDQFWLTDPVTRHDDAVVELFTNCACESGDNTRFMLANGELWCTRSDREPTDSSPAVPPDAPHVLYQDIDFGALDSRSSLYLVKVGLEGPLLQQQFDRGAVDFDADALPALFFLAANEGQAAALQEVDPVATGGRVPYLRANLRGSNTVTWRLPLGRTKGSSIDVRLELRGFSYDDVLKLPLQLFFARGGVVR